MRVLGSRGAQLIVLVVVLGVAGWAWLDAIGGADAVRERFGLRAAGVLVPLLAVVAASPAPSEPVAIVNGLIYGTGWAAALNWLGWMLAAYLQYGIAARVAGEIDRESWQARAPRWLQNVPAAHPAFLILGRYLPWGSHLVNATAGAHGVPLWTFTWCSAIALVPVAIAFAALGAGLA